MGSQQNDPFRTPSKAYLKPSRQFAADQLPFVLLPNGSGSGFPVNLGGSGLSSLPGAVFGGLVIRPPRVNTQSPVTTARLCLGAATRNAAEFAN